MATIKRTFVTRGENLRTIRPMIWREIQKYCSREFKMMGIEIPLTDEDFNDDFSNELSEKLKSFDITEDTSKLTDVLIGLDEFSSSADNSDFVNTLHAISEEHGIEDEFMGKIGRDQEQLSVIELGVLLLTDNRAGRRFKGYRECLAIDKSTFEYYDCTHDDHINFVKPSEADNLRLAALYKNDEKYRKNLKIKDYCEINMFDIPTCILDEDGEVIEVIEWWFNISRSNRPVVSGDVKKEGLHTVTYVPPTTDVVIVNPATRQIRTNVVSKTRLNVYLPSILKHVCPQEGVNYVKAESFTFAPLEQEGWQRLFTPDGIDRLSHVRLKEVEQQVSVAEGQQMRVVVKSDLRKSLSLIPQDDSYEAGDIRNLKRFHGVGRVVMEFVFQGESNPTVVRIPSPTSLCIKKKQNSSAVLMWLRHRGFVVEPRKKSH